MEMNVVILGIGVLAFFLLLRHVFCAFRFGSVLKREVGTDWTSQGQTTPVAFSHSDLKAFRSNNSELVESNELVRNSVARFENSWKYGMPMVLILAVAAAVLQRVFLFS
jgi:hypothetical protein